MSLPIRLVERGGSVINLDCLNYFFTVKKTIPTLPIPVVGQRYALDANIVNAEIRLVCMLRDDDCSSSDLNDLKAVGSIDFSSTSGGDGYLVGGGAQIIPAIADFNGSQVKIQASDLSTITANFNTGTNSNSTTGNTVTVGLGGLSDPVKGSDVASRLKTALESNSNFNDRFTVVRGNGRLAATLPNNERQTKLTFTQKVAGAAGNNFSPEFVSPMNADNTIDNNESVPHPAVSTFTGGSSNNCRSAGDKAQDILANIVNSNFTGLLGKGVVGLGTFGGENTLIEWVDPNGGRGFTDDINHEDYIVGLQIPYNSLRHASMGTVGDPIQGYEPRNFMMITGHVDSDEQGSAANDKPASVAFDPTDKYTGISGTLKDCELKYDAGNTVYEVTLTFAPIDYLLGV